MINEGRGISNIIKSEVNVLWDLFQENSYSKHHLTIGNDDNFKDYTLEFVKRNNYYSNLKVDKHRNCSITIGIPMNGKENRVKEVIVHELTHLIEIIGLNKKDYPKYWNIKKSLIKFKPFTKAGDFLKYLIYKTLDNEVNANVAQTYVYLNNFGLMSKSELLNKLKDYSQWIEYNNILEVDKEKLKLKIDKKEIEDLNNILLENGVRTIKNFDIDIWFKFWFKVFKKNAKVYLKNSQRMIDEILEKYKLEEYSTWPNTEKVVNYSEFLKNNH